MELTVMDGGILFMTDITQSVLTYNQYEYGAKMHAGLIEVGPHSGS